MKRPLPPLRPGRQVAYWRRQRGWTQQILADKVGLHRVFVAHIERGARTPSLDTLQRLALALEVEVVALLRDDGA